MKVEYTLRDLRDAKGISQAQLAQILKISPSLYSAIESGQRRPSIDILHTLAALYGTSMDFIYHAYYRKSVTYYYPDDDLRYALRLSKHIDLKYIRKRFPPANKPPKLPTAIFFDEIQDDDPVPYKITDETDSQELYSQQ